MKHTRLISSLLPLCLAVASLSAHAETGYIASLKAKVLQEPNFKAPVIVEFEKGQSVEVLKSQGTWLNISADGKTGWVSKFLVKDTLPVEKVTVLPGDDETQLKDVRRRTSAITTAAAARGLAATASDSDSKHESNAAGVKYMESFKVSPKELLAFEKAIQGGAK